MTEFEDYASYLDEDYSQERQLQEQEEENQRHCDAEPAWDDDDYNNPQQTIEREVEL
jgi:hypothetical protein